MGSYTAWFRGAVLVALAAAGGAVATEAPAAGPSGPSPSPARAPRPALAAFGNLFVENRGQTDAAVAFTLPGRGRDFYFTAEGVRVVLTGGGRRWTVAQEFLGARCAKPEGTRPGPTSFSWFRGPRASWVTGAKSHREITYREAWPGIDVVYSAGTGALKHEFRVRPGADPARIALGWRGGTPELTDDGGLRVATPAGAWDDAAPVAWQETEAGRAPVEAAYLLASDGTVTFRLGAYDRALPLVIDPATIVYAGYVSGLDGSGAADIAVDALGSAYVTGNTQSSAARGFPVAVGPDLTYNPNGGVFETDVFVAKVAPDGTSLAYCGYIGGDSYDLAKAIAVDTQGRAYVTGWTSSPTPSFPAAVGPALAYSGAGNDAFVARVAADGTSLEYCGYIGGDQEDNGSAIAVDPQGRAYVAGVTSSPPATFPETSGPEAALTAGAAGFIARVKADGSGFDYCGYVGGASASGAELRGVAVDPSGSAYICGVAGEGDIGTAGGLPVKTGPSLVLEGSTDAIVAKVRPDGTGYVYFGLIAGDALDAAEAIAVDDDGAAYVTGNTASDETTFPVAVGPDLTLNGLNNPSIGGEGFIAKVKPNGSGLDYCGYLGSAGHDEVVALALDATGSAHVAVSVDDLATFQGVGGPELASDPNLSGASIVARVRADGAGLVWSGYVGSTGWTGMTGLALDGGGDVCFCGETASSNFVTVAGPGARKVNNRSEATVARISVTGYVDGSEPGGGGGEGEAIESFFLPRKVTAKTNAKSPARSTLTLSGFFDTGPADAALSGAATLDAGGFHFDIPGLVPAGKGFAYTAPGVFFAVIPNKSGSSRAKFRLKTTGDLGGRIDASGDLTLAFANAAVDAEGTVGLAGGAYALGKRRGALKSPNLYLAKAKASLKGAGKSAFSIVAGLATNGVTPAAASDVTVEFGTYTATVPAASFTQKGDAFEFKGTDPGITLVRLDYLRETVTIAGKALTLPAFGASPVVVRIGVAVGADERAVRVRMGAKGTSLRY